jgi:hypothetical protein
MCKPSPKMKFVGIRTRLVRSLFSLASVISALELVVMVRLVQNQK